jgi:uncharacterized circularly permuted ATP-grasp superfamily protein/uncharacterized alpha-E superfamily protein
MSSSDNAPVDSAEVGTEFLRSYEPHPGVYDELMGNDGSVRVGWRALLEDFSRIGERQRELAREQSRRLLNENNVTYVPQGEEPDSNRLWELDLLPMLVTSDEWQRIASGVIQRTVLLNRILADVYGEQRTLHQGALPAGLVFGNPDFLRPWCHIPVPENLHLHFLAYDLARAPDGGWWVIRHRTQSPTGAGFALENRVITSHCLPELFTTRNVQRLASFFRAFSEHFLSLSSYDEPTAVVLSSGPSRRTYFEHAYLARYLGFSLVEGSDLTVRSDRLFMKTVEGLKPIDLVLRRVRADLCDPLELTTDSVVGVPGLLQAARAGNVTIGNGLGSGLVESSAFMSFLPGLCRLLLDQDLEIPSVATWWCGQVPERDYVLGNLDALDVQRIAAFSRGLSGAQAATRMPADLDPERRAQLVEDITLRGHAYFGQEAVSLSTTPHWHGSDRIEASPMVLRVYVAATAEGYQVMPGGLTRISLFPDSRSSWPMAGEISKDTWVVQDEPVDAFSLLAEREKEKRLRRTMGILPSRAADNLFWLGRYAERAEAAVRLLRSLVIRLSGETGSTRHLLSPDRVASLLVVQKHLSPRRARRATQLGREGIETELHNILFDPESRDGLAPVLGNVRRTADVVRERLSFDTYRILKDLTDVVQRSDAAASREFGGALQLLNRMVQYIAAFNGMVMENMTRGYGWQFLDMGRRLERLRTMSQLIQQLVVRGQPESDGALELLLELADSTMTYRGRYRAAPQLATVLDLLLSDDTNPRSAIFQIISISDRMRVLPRVTDEGVLAEDERVTTRLTSELRLADVYRLADTVNRFDSRIELDRLARSLDEGMKDLSNLIADRYFSHSAPRRVSGT